MPTIYALPGMGADSRMYDAHWNALPQFVRCEWNSAFGLTGVATVAMRLIQTYGIQNGDVVIGTSLGGIIGCEIANYCSLSKLVLISSVTNPAQVNSILRTIAPAGKFLPFGMLQISASSVDRKLMQMFADIDGNFLRDMCCAIPQWKGLSPTQTADIVRIHGMQDLVIPVPPNTDLPLSGGHLITMTHSETIVNYLATILVPNHREH